MEKSNEKIYFKNVDFLRFVFILCIVVLHLVHIAASPLHDDSSLIYRNNTKNMNYCVEMFFIISGFFLIRTLKLEQSVREFIKKRFIRLSPVMIFTVLLFAVTSIFGITKFWAMDNIFALLFLNGLQIANHPSPFGGLGNIHSTWFISILFWVSLLYFYVLKKWDRKYFNLLLPIIIIMCLYYRSHNVQIAFDIFNFNLIRGVGSISLGCILGLIFNSNIDKIKNITLNKCWKTIFTLAETGIFGYLIFGLFFATKDRLVYTDYIFLFVALFILFVLKQGYFSLLFENKFSVFLGKISYSIFVSHNLLLDIFQKYYFFPGKAGALAFVGGG